MATPAEDTLAREIEADRCRAGQAEKDVKSLQFDNPRKKTKKHVFLEMKKCRTKRYKKDSKVMKSYKLLISTLNLT